MQTFFIVDSIKDLDKKIDNIISNIGDNIKFFVKAKFYTRVAQNSFLLKNIAGVYNNKPNYKIDEYLKSDKCAEVDATLLYYASVDVGEDVLKRMREKMTYNYDSVFVNSKQNWWNKLTGWFYKKITKLMYRVSDVNCSTKIQLISKRFMQYLQETTFCNHPFEVSKMCVINVAGKEQVSTLKSKIRFNKYNLYNLLALLIIWVAFVICEAHFDLPFFVYFAVVLSTILAIVVALMLWCFSKFNSRSQFSRKGDL